MDWMFQVHVMLVLVWDIDGITWGWSNFYILVVGNLRQMAVSTEKGN
jgi:hypothetical protein